MAAHRLFILAALVLLATLTGGAQSASQDFRAEFWTDLDMMPVKGEPYPLPETLAASRLLDEAAWVYSGMIEGFSFEWTPENKGRQIKESFVLGAAAAIPKGDPRLVPGAPTRSETRLSAWIDFRPDASDLLFLESSQSPDWKSGQGRGMAPRSEGFSGRRAAYVAAAKAALEAWARSTEATRPRKIGGRLVFASVPLVAVENDSWVVTARLRLEILDVERWSIF
ncbi:MAG TPA: hypothetical protein VMV44_14265 [Rectinemataceae bacterium]|nr:hypothetical protein [Rectinemataceae bacterium]